MVSPRSHPAYSSSSGAFEEDSPMEPQQSRTKKRVEWSSDVNSTELPASDHRSPMWDSETDHNMLSYFLGDSTGNGMPSPPMPYAAAASSSQSHSYPSASHHVGGVRHSVPMLVGHPRSASSMVFGGGSAPPSTPATQYYYSSHSSSKSNKRSSPVSAHTSQSTTSTSGSNADALMKARESLLSGSIGGAATTTTTEAAHLADELSPISPAALIGSAEHEPLMLPPSPDKQYHYPIHPHGNSNNAHSNNGNTTATPNHAMANQSHLEWLQHINAMAKASIHTPAQVSMQPPMPAAHSTMPPPPVTSNTAVPPMAAHAIQQFSNGVAIPPHRAGDMLYTHLARLQKAPPASEAESEEKRARRLERNRESARKSRRRKKERLSHLGEKVAALHTKLATARQKDINLMNDGLQNDSRTMLSKLRTLENSNQCDLGNQLHDWEQSTGPNCKVRRAVVDFQYSTLEQTLLARYEKFLLWLTLHQEEYFTTAKDLHSKRDGKQLMRNSSGKLSSKQVGEELTNAQNGKEKNADKTNLTAQAFDDQRMWPLLCYELSVSVDQEDKFMQAHKRNRQMQHLGRDRSQIAAAARMASKLKEAVLYQSHAAAVRREKSYVGILTPQQTLLYQEWLAKNQERCKEKLSQRKADSIQSGAEQACLMDVCKKLEAVLKISHEGDDAMI